MIEKSIKRYRACLSNYYGSVELTVSESCGETTRRLVLDDYSGSDWVDVSEEFAEAFIKEFEHNGVSND